MLDFDVSARRSWWKLSKNYFECVGKDMPQINKIIKCWGKIINNISLAVSEWLLLNANSAICQLCHGENKLIVNEMMMSSTLYSANKLIFIVLAHWNNIRGYTCSPTRTHYPESLLFSLNYVCLAEKQQISFSFFYIFYIFFVIFIFYRQYRQYWTITQQDKIYWQIIR